jgi:hypothetical protein
MMLTADGESRVSLVGTRTVRIDRHVFHRGDPQEVPLHDVYR